MGLPAPPLLSATPRKLLGVESRPINGKQTPGGTTSERLPAMKKWSRKCQSLLWKCFQGPKPPTDSLSLGVTFRQTPQDLVNLVKCCAAVSLEEAVHKHHRVTSFGTIPHHAYRMPVHVNTNSRDAHSTDLNAFCASAFSNPHNCMREERRGFSFCRGEC